MHEILNRYNTISHKSIFNSIKLMDEIFVNLFLFFIFLLYQMFEPPVTFIESKKQKTVFEDVDGSKVIAYLEKSSPGTITASTAN